MSTISKLKDINGIIHTNSPELMALITLLDAQLAFGHVALLDHADFSLENNQRIGLIGRNGTGKSSLLKILAGLEKPDDGTLQLQQNLRIAYVPQEPSLDPHATVFVAASAGWQGRQRPRAGLRRSGGRHDRTRRHPGPLGVGPGAPDVGRAPFRHGARFSASRLETRRRSGFRRQRRCRRAVGCQDLRHQA